MDVSFVRQLFGSVWLIMIWISCTFCIMFLADFDNFDWLGAFSALSTGCVRSL